ncbi:MAG: pentapeptide repeat-containing protein [Rhodospirillales bacterium]|nr:pentapeptide repeat-containing protein [Rhodospirillales bacterium]
MKLCVDDNWLRRKIANDPLVEVEAGRSIRCAADVVKAIEAAALHSESAPGKPVHTVPQWEELIFKKFGERVRGVHTGLFDGADLADADLARAFLVGANLSGADLSGASLADAILARAFLVNADLSGANLSGASLTGANLSGANLTRASLTGANLNGANLTDALLFDADLTGMDFPGANLTGATGLTQEMLRSAWPSPRPKNLPTQLSWPFEHGADDKWRLRLQRPQTAQAEVPQDPREGWAEPDNLLALPRCR